MTNPYFERPASVAAGTTIRSDKYNSDLDTQESAFNALHDKLQHAVFLPETFSGNPNIPEQTVENTFIYIDASGNIALYPIQTFLDAFARVEEQYNQISLWKDQVEEDAVEAQNSATLSQRFANEDEDVEVIGGLFSAKHWAKHAEAQIPLVEAAGQAKVDAAQLKVNEAQASATMAQNYANANKNVEVEAGLYSAKHFSLIAQDQLALVEAAGQGKVDDAQAQVALATTQASNASASATKADNFANYAHNQLVPNSGGKYSSYHWAKEAEAYAQQTLSAVNGDFVPITRTVNGKALNQNIIIGTADIQGLATVATSGSYNDLSNKPTVSSLGAAPASHGHADYVVKSSNATLNSLVTLGGITTGGAVHITRSDSGQTPYSQASDFVIEGAADTGMTIISGNTSDARIFFADTDSQFAGFIVYDHDLDVMKFGVGNSGSEKIRFTSSGDITVNNKTVWHEGSLPNPVQTGDLATVATSGSYNDLSNKPNAASVGAVPTSRTVNNKALSSNITLSASDVNALPSTTTLSTLGGVPTSRKVNNKALTGNITLTSSDVGAIPNTQNGSKLTRVSGSFTATKLAGVTEYVTSATGNSTCTVNQSAFSADDKLIIQKQYESGQLTITAGVQMYLKNGTSATSHHIPAGTACTVELVWTGSSALLRVYN